MADGTHPSRARFAAAIGSTFRLSAGEGWPREAELTELRGGPSSPGWEQFALTFRVPGPGIPPQGTYRVAHDRLGEFDLFLVPVGQDAGGVQMEAVFNRPAQPGTREG